jgi:hypothetical protein
MNVVNTEYLWGNKRISFSKNRMYIEPVDNVNELDFWEKRLDDYAVYKIELENQNKHYFTIVIN